MSDKLTTIKPSVTAKPSAINLMAARMSVDPAKLFDTLKATVFQKATNEELLALVVVANTYNLNPFLKELYAFPAKGGGIVPIVSVDGWNKMLVNQPDFDGIEFEFTDDEAGNPVACTATIHVKNRSHPVKITEYMAECKRNTDPWNNMPRRMLRNRTLCQASRVAFGFSGVKHEEEADAINVESIITSADAKQLGPPPKVVTPEKPPQAELESLLVTAGFTFTDLQKFGVETGNIEGADSMGSFADIPTDICRRLLRAQKGLLTSLESVAKAKESK
jgi:phage recombination protein Bet